jgi:hypothetical protein
MTAGRCLLLLGFVCLIIMVFTHVAETLRLFSGMGWGLPNSPGHYVDFASAGQKLAYVYFEDEPGRRFGYQVAQQG